MKRIIAAMAMIVGISSPAWADYTITSPSRGVTVKTCSWDAEAVCSVKWSGKEFIDDYDHGRQLQSSMTVSNASGDLEENYNPNEAGAEVPYNGVNPSASTSIAVNYSTLATPPTVKGVNMMSYWRPVNGVARSNWLLTKNIQLYEGSYATYMRYEVQYAAPKSTGEPSWVRGKFETLTGYMPVEFNNFYTLDVKGSRQLASISYCTPPYATCSPEQGLPLIFANSNGTHAMGIYNRSLPQSTYPGAGFGRWNYQATGINPVVKWNAVFRIPNIVPDGVYIFVNYVIVGSLANVKAQMQWMYDNNM